MTPQLLTARDVADRLQVSAMTVYTWARLGELPCVRIRRIIRFKEADVRVFIEANTSAVNTARLRSGRRLR
jgi:excisionase family DNA binding protein